MIQKATLTLPGVSRYITSSLCSKRFSHFKRKLLPDISPLDLIEDISSVSISTQQSNRITPTRARMSKVFLHEIGYDPEEYNRLRRQLRQGRSDSGMYSKGKQENILLDSGKTEKSSVQKTELSSTIDSNRPDKNENNNNNSNNSIKGKTFERPTKTREQFIADLPFDMPAWKREKFLRNYRDRTQGAWLPPKKISREDMDKVRILHTADPLTYSVKALSLMFHISYEAVTRIMRSKFVPTVERQREMEVKRKEARIIWRLKTLATKKESSSSSGDWKELKSSTVEPSKSIDSRREVPVNRQKSTPIRNHVNAKESVND